MLSGSGPRPSHQDPESHALMLFPLKALERDQLDSFRSLSTKIGVSAAVYDGDTPESERKKESGISLPEP